MIKNNLLEILHEMEEVTKLFKLDPFDIYILGGGACILGEYTNRATMDIDMLEYESTILSPNYKKRATKLEEFRYINVYILSKEDVVISKIIRLAEKDIEDLNQIIPNCDKKLLNDIIEEIINRDDLFESKKKEFLKKLELFRRKYNV